VPSLFLADWMFARERFSPFACCSPAEHHSHEQATSHRAIRPSGRRLEAMSRMNAAFF
jgi:hypothetical protein